MATLAGLTEIQQLALELSTSLRLGHLAKSHQLTIEFIDLLSQYINQNSIDDTHFHQVLNIMLDTQQRDDRLYYADLLQYELMPYLINISDNKE
ncbi:hypothetical protein ACOYR1_03500 [Thalassotalea piscium]